MLKYTCKSSLKTYINDIYKVVGSYLRQRVRKSQYHSLSQRVWSWATEPCTRQTIRNTSWHKPQSTPHWWKHISCLYFHRIWLLRPPPAYTHNISTPPIWVALPFFCLTLCRQLSQAFLPSSELYEDKLWQRIGLPHELLIAMSPDFGEISCLLFFFRPPKIKCTFSHCCPPHPSRKNTCECRLQ